MGVAYKYKGVGYGLTILPMTGGWTYAVELNQIPHHAPVISPLSEVDAINEGFVRARILIDEMLGPIYYYSVGAGGEYRYDLSYWENQGYIYQAQIYREGELVKTLGGSAQVPNMEDAALYFLFRSLVEPEIEANGAVWK